MKRKLYWQPGSCYSDHLLVVYYDDIIYQFDSFVRKYQTLLEKQPRISRLFLFVWLGIHRSMLIRNDLLLIRYARLWKKALFLYLR